MKENIKTIITGIFVSITFFGVGFFFMDNLKDISRENQLAQALKEEEIKIPEIKNTTIYFVGDMILTRGVKSSIDKNFGGDYSKLFENLGELKEADILFANLEGDVSDKGNNVGSKYSFRMDPIVLPAIKEAGFDIVSFANNHVGDWNMTAFKDTLDKLGENGILKTGAGINKEDAENPTIIEKNGIRFGFLGFSDVGPNWLKATKDKAGILLANDERFEEIIQNAKTKTDVLIISIHFGEEYKLVHNKRQEDLAHRAIDSGADLIIGHHPHVMEDIEKYNGKTIVYSLGNFIFDQYFSKDTMRGMLFSATFKEKDLIKTEQKIITLSKQYQPEGISDFGEKEIVKIEEKKEEVKEIEENEESKKEVDLCMNSTEDFEDLLYWDLGQEVELPSLNYVPKDLKELDTKSSTRKGVCMIQEAVLAFQSMVEKAKENGITIKATSGFRSYNTQKILFENALKKDEARAKISIAKPGHSEHQLGSAVDITGSTVDFSSATSRFNNSPEDLWLRENAHLYGFIQSYPENKEDITGYRYESWHYRYVGIDKAKEIKEKDITIGEFLSLLNIN